MRHHKELDFLIRNAIKLSNSTMPITILAYDEEELKWIKDHLKGKKGNAKVSVVLDTPELGARVSLERWTREDQIAQTG